MLPSSLWMLLFRNVFIFVLALKRATPFFFVAKMKVTKEKTRGLTVSLLMGVVRQCLCYPQRAKAASGGLTFRLWFCLVAKHANCQPQTAN
ncbi:hypothetical protein [Mucilaginibacter sp. 10I4]|uniref:hypothetical protein n=1 Tax=Mucilaginibacter sp. 10I4 TaxID=3048580 RepID=UPI002B233646|nr:hypothetical protein [Mucilaginibacter sp. 10I4]